MMEVLGLILFTTAVGLLLRKSIHIRTLSTEELRRLWGQSAKTITNWIDRAFKQESRRKLSQLLERAGLPKGSESHFILRQIFLSGSGFIFGFMLLLAGLPCHFPFTLGILGWIWPRMKLNATVRKRQREILLNLPYHLDLTTLALEAGLDLIAAIEEILRHDRPNPLREELTMTLSSIQMGSTRSAAFAQLADRTGLRPLSLLAAAVAQSEELGTSLGNLFRLQAEALRRELYRKAEEEAQRAPIKLLVPLIGLIFPVVFLLLFAPIVIRFFY